MTPPNLLHPKALPPFAALRAFEALGRTGSIRKAATSLGLDHAVVSRHIRALEDWIGVPLVHRTQGRVTLTDEGASYHARVSGALVELASATSALAKSSDQKHLRLWCIPGFAAQWLSDQLAEFERLRPQYHIELRPTDNCANLLMHEADIDIRYYGDDWQPHPGGRSLRSIELARPEVIAVASPELASRGFETVSELLDAPLLHEEHDEQWRAWLRLNGVEHAGSIPGPLLWHAHLAITAARQGRGIALANSYLVARDLEAGHLVEVRPTDARPVILGAYVFVAREDRWSIPAIAELRRFLVSRTG